MQKSVKKRLAKELKLQDEKGNKYPTIEGFPNNCAKQAQIEAYRINGAISFHTYIDAENIIVYQVIEFYGGYFIITDYWLSKSKILMATSGAPICELFTTLEGKIAYHMEDERPRNAIAGTYNIIVATFVANKARVPAEHVRTADIHFSDEYFQTLCSKYPQLEELSKALKNKQRAFLHPDAGSLTHDSVCQIHSLIRKFNKGVLSGSGLSAKIEKIIHSIFEPRGVLAAKSNLFTNGKSESLSFIIDMLKEDLDEFYTVSELIEKNTDYAPLTPVQIRNGIKEIYGMTTIAFLKHNRALRIKELIDQGQKEVDVATLTGYADKHLSHLERDFYKEFGISLADYKKLRARTKGEGTTQIG